MHKSRYLALVASLVLLAGSTATEAFGQVDVGHSYNSPEYVSWEKNLNFYEHWYSFDFPISARAPFTYAASMKVRIAPSGSITHLSVRDSSGSPTADFSCLESLMSSAPYKAMPKKRHIYPEPLAGSAIENNFDPDRYQNIVTFGGQTSQPKAFPEAEAFYSKYPYLKNRSYLMHLIPLGINSHYPNLFTADELKDSSNLVALKGNVDPDEAIQPFLDAWQQFISKHPNATKMAVKKEAAQIKVNNQRCLVVYKSEKN